MSLRFLFLLSFLALFNNGEAQTPVHDTTNTVIILPGTRSFMYRRIDAETELQILSGNVRLRQGTTVFSCDSCVINEKANTI